MDTVVLKFGGSSVADNIKLNIVAEKIKEFYDENKRIVIVVSAQGKTTDELIKEAMSLSSVPNERELDVLLSSGEQMSMAKLSILLNRLGMKAISLTGWQAGIFTNNTNQDAIIEDIDTSRIEKELNNGNIVIVAGFQGINRNMDITTLGRGGSDTTAVAIAAKIKANHCYIFSDVDGVYSADPKKTKVAKKIDAISYSEMLDIADEGAKVLHNRCVEVGERFNIPIVAKSTFIDNSGTLINDKIEGSTVKSIVKNDDLKYVHITSKTTYSVDIFNNIYYSFIENELNVKNLVNSSADTIDITFTISKSKFNKFAGLLEDKWPELNATYLDITRISVIGNGIMSNNSIVTTIMHIVDKNHLNIISMEINEAKIAIIFKEIIPDEILEELHKALIS
ncbi:MAG TPA: aspartate kinase [Clostridiales bacterium]|nr:aspartate kinase [Clostridiales bacterium]